MKPILPLGIALALTAAAAAPTVEQMRGHRRVLLVAAPGPDAAALLRQRRLIAGWTQAGDDRDVSIVEVIGDRVRGSSDDARMLRRVRHLPRNVFTVLLIGKDGQEAVRSRDPLSSQTIAATIDAMPMRRAGGR